MPTRRGLRRGNSPRTLALASSAFVLGNLQKRVMVGIASFRSARALRSIATLIFSHVPAHSRSGEARQALRWKRDWPLAEGTRRQGGSPMAWLSRRKKSPILRFANTGYIKCRRVWLGVVSKYRNFVRAEHEMY